MTSYKTIAEDIRENWLLYFWGLVGAGLLFYASTPNSNPKMWPIAKLLMMLMGLWCCGFVWDCISTRRYAKIWKYIPSIAILAMLPLQGYGIIRRYEQWQWQVVEIYSALFLLNAVWRLTHEKKGGHNTDAIVTLSNTQRSDSAGTLMRAPDRSRHHLDKVSDHDS